jgi:hypothetical protein
VVERLGVVADCVKGQKVAVARGTLIPRKMEELNELECGEFLSVSEVVQEVNL